MKTLENNYYGTSGQNGTSGGPGGPEVYALNIGGPKTGGGHYLPPGVYASGASVEIKGGAGGYGGTGIFSDNGGTGGGGGAGGMGVLLGGGTLSNSGTNLLTHGFYCAYALESIARHYVRVMGLVDHYCAEMDLNYRRVRYEDIVDDQEASIRRVLDFIDAEFDPACLAFHENRRYARTASYAQVTEKLYERSRYRYRHYLPQLQPIIPILQPVIERLGYAV